MKIICKCPRCTGQLIEEGVEDKNFESIHLATCDSCEGQLVSEEHLENLSEVHTAQFIELRDIPSQKVQYEPIFCPLCEEHPQMVKVKSVRDKNVITDVCPTCKSIWLDKGELDAIQNESLLPLAWKVMKFMMK